MQYLDTTFYDRAVNWFLDQPFIAFIVLICVIIMAIPQLRDGIKFYFKRRRNRTSPLNMQVRPSPLKRNASVETLILLKSRLQPMI